MGTHWAFCRLHSWKLANWSQKMQNTRTCKRFERNAKYKARQPHYKLAHTLAHKLMICSSQYIPSYCLFCLFVCFFVFTAKLFSLCTKIVLLWEHFFLFSLPAIQQHVNVNVDGLAWYNQHELVCTKFEF